MGMRFRKSYPVEAGRLQPRTSFWATPEAQRDRGVLNQAIAEREQLRERTRPGILLGGRPTQPTVGREPSES